MAVVAVETVGSGTIGEAVQEQVSGGQLSLLQFSVHLNSTIKQDCLFIANISLHIYNEKKLALTLDSVPGFRHSVRYSLNIENKLLAQPLSNSGRLSMIENLVLRLIQTNIFVFWIFRSLFE